MERYGKWRHFWFQKLPGNEICWYDCWINQSVSWSFCFLRQTWAFQIKPQFLKDSLCIFAFRNEPKNASPSSSWLETYRFWFCFSYEPTKSTSRKKLADFNWSPGCFDKPRLIGWLKSIRLEPGGRWGSILGVFLEQHYVRSLWEIVFLLGRSIL